MNAKPGPQSLQELEAELRDALIIQCRLNHDAIEQVESAMRDAQLGFGEAAVRTGVVTPREAAESLLWVRQMHVNSERSIVETAIHNGKHSRALIFRHSEQVKASNRLTLLYRPDDPRSERIRALRTELLLLFENSRQANFLAVLSPGSGEGRSLLCAELAIAFSQLGRRTLLVDADLRRPNQQVLFQAGNQWGLAQALAFSNSCPLLGVEGVPNLSLLTAGPISSNPLELLSAGNLESMLRDWRRHYDFVLFDTPPISQYADGLALAALAGNALILTRAHVTAHREMKEMLRRLANTQARIVGAVLNDF